MGNQVIFGLSGGVIRNLRTGAEVPFYKRDGVYVFTMWVAPPEQVVKASPTFVGQP